MTTPPEMSPREVAAMDEAFEAGVAEAVRQGSALLMMRMAVADVPTWVCAYPPAFVKASDIAAWTKRQGYAPQDGDLFVPREQVLQAAHDLGIGGV
jgi:hypothetical protein